MSAFHYNRVIDPADFKRDDFVQDMKEASGNDSISASRKLWEWGMGLRVLREFGFLERSKTAIGLGTGYEPFAFVLSRYVNHVMRTDYIDKGNPFMNNYADKVRGTDSGVVEFLPPGMESEPERIRFLDLDATNMHQIDDCSVDIVYSFSSIEHFGDRINHPPHGAIECMRESERVLRPGGICIGATELLLNKEMDSQFFRDEDFTREMINSHSMQPVDKFDFTLPDELYHSKYYFNAALRALFKAKEITDPHLGVVVGNAVIVSVFFAFLKK